MVMLRRMTAIVLILVLALPLAGCWSRRELNTLGIVGLVGVDTSGAGIKTTFEVIKPEKPSKSGGDRTQTPVKYVQASGRTIMETFRDASLRFDRKLFVSHAKGFLFSEEIARNGLAEHLDAILRFPEMRVSMHLVIIQGTAADVMGISSGINEIPSNYVEDLLRQYKVHSTSIDSKVLDFLKAYTGQGINPVVSVLKKVKKAKIGKEESDGYELTPEGAAVFRKDRLVGYLDGGETRGYNWVIGKVSGGTVTFPTPGSAALTSVQILRADSKNDVEISGNDIKIKVKIKMDGMLDEQTAGFGITEPQAVMAALEQATAQAINQEVAHTLARVQTYKSDIFGFGQLVHRKYPKEWRTIQDRWDELFSQAIIEVETQAKITKSGKSTYPVKE